MTRDRVALAAVFAFALAIRLLNLQQIHANDPYFTLPSVDGRVFHAWAIEIADGDWLGDRVFILGPLYAYFIAAVYALFGPSLLALKLVQCVIGSFTCVLVFVLARELFDRRVARVAGGMAAVYGMLIFYEGAVVITNVLMPIVLLLLIASVRALASARPRDWLLAGALDGLAALGRESALLFAPIVLLWMFRDLRERVGVRRRLALAAAFCAGLAALVLPATLRNLAVSGDVVLINAAGGFAFYTGNHPGADGTYKIPARFPRGGVDDPEEQLAVWTRHAERESGRSLSPSQVAGFWYRQGWEFIRSQPLAWLRLEAFKALLFVNALEVWSNRSFTVDRQFSWVLRLPLLSFGVVAPLAILGLLAVEPRRQRRLAPLYAMLGVHLLTALAFFVLARYRLPVVPILLIFAASAVVQLLDATRARQWRALALAAVVLAVGTAVVHLPLREEPLDMAHYNLGNRYRALGDWERAIDEYASVIRLSPADVSAWVNLAVCYESAGGREPEAIAAWTRVRELARRRGLTGFAERASGRLEALGVGEAIDPDGGADASVGGPLPQ